MDVHTKRQGAKSLASDRRGASWVGKIALRVFLGAPLASSFSLLMIPIAHADDAAVPKLEGVYRCEQNTNMTGSVWHPVECRSLTGIEDQTADGSSAPAVHFDHVEPNPFSGVNVWWNVNFKGVGRATDKTAHWVCSDHDSGFTCVWQTTNNAEDWEAYNQFRAMGVSDIPSVFWVPKSLVERFIAVKALLQLRGANEVRYAKAETLAGSDSFPWSFVPPDGGACRPLGSTTPFKFMQSIGSKRHPMSVNWDTNIGDDDRSRSVVAESSDPAIPLNTGRVQEYRFYVNVDECNAALAQSLPHGGIIVSGVDLQHKPAVKWVITDDSESDKIACHWPSVVTGTSPDAFLAVLRGKGATITEISPHTLSTADKRTIFEISFSYILKGRPNQISWSDLGDYNCDPAVKDRLQLP